MIPFFGECQHLPSSAVFTDRVRADIWSCEIGVLRQSFGPATYRGLRTLSYSIVHRMPARQRLHVRYYDCDDERGCDKGFRSVIRSRTVSCAASFLLASYIIFPNNHLHGVPHVVGLR